MMPVSPKNDRDTIAAETSVMGSPSKLLGGSASATRERTPENSTIAHHINQAIKAHGTMKRDVDYVVKDGDMIYFRFNV